MYIVRESHNMGYPTIYFIMVICKDNKPKAKVIELFFKHLFDFIFNKA